MVRFLELWHIRIGILVDISKSNASHESVEVIRDSKTAARNEVKCTEVSSNANDIIALSIYNRSSTDLLNRRA
jgi:hypothetical protein